MAVEIDENWSDNLLEFAVRCYGPDWLRSKYEIFDWLVRSFDFSGERWQRQIYQDQDMFCAFSVTFESESDAIAFKLRWL